MGKTSRSNDTGREDPASKKQRTETAGKGSSGGQPTAGDVFYVKNCREPSVEEMKPVEARAVVKLTPLELQVLQFRRKVDPHVILFIAVGYKYKVFGRDSHVAARRLGIMCIPAEPFEYSSIPTQRVGYHTQRLVAMGYTVAIVQQESAALRIEGGTKASQVFTRTLSPLLSKATMLVPPTIAAGSPTAGGGDGEGSDDEGDGGGGAGEQDRLDSLDDPMALGDKFILVLVEQHLSSTAGETSKSNLLEEKGILLSAVVFSFVKGVAVYAFPSSTLDARRSALEDILTVAEPVEVVAAVIAAASGGKRNTSPQLSAKTKSMLTSHLKLNEWPTKEGTEDANNCTYTFHNASSVSEWWPAGTDLTKEHEGPDASALELKSKCPAYHLALHHVAKHDLRSTLSSFDVRSMSEIVTGVSSSSRGQSSTLSTSSMATMKLPGNTLRNLEILQASVPMASHGGGNAAAIPSAFRGSLLWLLNRCKTAFGFRLMKNWVTRPLVQKVGIDLRADAIEFLVNNQGAADALKSLFAKPIRDLESTLTRLAMAKCSASEYVGFLQTVAQLASDAKSACPNVLHAGEDHVPELILHLCNAISGGSVHQEIKGLLSEIHTGQSSLPTEPWQLYVTADYATQSASCPDIIKDLLKTRNGILEELDDFLQSAQQKYRFSSLNYKTVLTATFLLEIPSSEEKKAPKDWTVSSRTKSNTRFSSPETTDWVNALAANAERIRLAGVAHWEEIQRKYWGVASVQSSKRKCAEFVASIGQLDVLVALTQISAQPGYCRPTMLPLAEKLEEEEEQDGSPSPPRFIELQNLKHPMQSVVMPEGQYVPNDVTIGQGDEGRVWLTTGANMGGKSALMRSVALCVVMAQMGCFVPCTKATLPIFTSLQSRMGAEDDLLTGKSTFLTEMAETSAILNAEDLSSSMVLMDEIGRGTSSFDGVAVADAVLDYLVKSNCIALFITHYPSLSQRWLLQQHSPVSCKYMAFADVEQDATKEGSNRDRRIVFLYKVVDGVTPSSFGLNIARAAAIPDPVIQLASTQSEWLEHETSTRQAAHAVSQHWK